MTNSSPGFLAIAICALTFTLLGIAYTIAGFAGGPDLFRLLGPGFLAGGLVLGGVTLPARRRARAALAAQTARTRATVVGAELHPHVRVGALLNVTLTIRFGGGEYSRRLNVSPLMRLEPGSEIEVVYDPANPANFRLA
jgi:hypothetical protein